MINRPHTRYEKRLYKEGYKVIVGVDEVGRGSWAGPLVAAAVVMPLKPRLNGVRDSKKLTPKRRDELSQRIQDRASAWSIGIVSHEEIDEIGISQANQQAMLRAVEGLVLSPDYILIDAFKLVGLPAKHAAVAHGDAMVYSIAAASIVAKVYRDELMTEYHDRYDVYGFDTNKGYGTPKHITALEEHGLCPIHRTSFHPMQSMV